VRATLLIGGTVVELDPPRAERVDLVIHDDRIGDLETPVPTTSTIDCSGCLIMPGLVLGHTHLYSALAPGMPAPSSPPTSFREILERVWWRLDRALDAESIETSARIGAAQAARAGITTIIDHHESPSLIDGALDLVAKGVEEIGLRGVLTYGATDRHGAEGARSGLKESERFAKKTASHPFLRGAIGLHAPFTCSEETMKESAAIAQGLGAWLHLHAAEGPDDQSAAIERLGKSLLAHLDEIGILGERTLLAHAVDVSDSEAELIQTRRAWVTHQARSNMNNGVGYAHKLGRLDRVALGTDGIDQDVLAELRAAFFRRREATGPAQWPDPIAMLASGHRLASAIFGQRLGSLQRGAPADVVVLAYDSPTPLDARTLGAHLLFGLSSAHVRDVFVAGRPVLRNRRLVGIDERELADRARQVAAKLWRRM
jgi:putative selenium metabolism protein SsnA